MRELNTHGVVTVQPGEYGTTIRRGSKWADVSKGERVSLTQGKEHPVCVGTAEVSSVSQMRFVDIPQGVFQRIHTKNKCYADVLAAMKRAYGFGFSEHEVVTVLEYKRLQ